MAPCQRPGHGATGQQRRSRLDDQLAAAHQFNWLITSVPLNQVMLCRAAVRFTSVDLEGFADAGVRLFLDAYRRS
jgi:TetR/AcrR family transcriptional repressor of mexJK operon